MVKTEPPVSSIHSIFTIQYSRKCPRPNPNPSPFIGVGLLLLFQSAIVNRQFPAPMRLHPSHSSGSLLFLFHSLFTIHYSLFE